MDCCVFSDRHVSAGLGDYGLQLVSCGHRRISEGRRANHRDHHNGAHVSFPDVLSGVRAAASLPKAVIYQSADLHHRVGQGRIDLGPAASLAFVGFVYVGKRGRRLGGILVVSENAERVFRRFVISERP